MAVRIWAGADANAPAREEDYTVTHTGLVVGLGEHNWSDDSDFYAIVWDAEAGKPREVEYGTTRFWTYRNSATVDATPEVAAAYEAYLADRREEYAAHVAAMEAARLAKGKTARVVRGRKVPVGTTGEVIWLGPGRYGQRVGLKDEAGTVHWTAAANVEVVVASE